MRCAGFGGSSPRVRGTQVTKALIGDNTGIIPACAGNTVPIGLAVSPEQDHPRVCGEHRCANCIALRHTGSSPRVRGTPYDKPNSARFFGIIPACAGNTLAVPASHTMVWDHPRVCGEHFCVCVEFDSVVGSSPRVRGTQASMSSHRPLPGIIPACAGNTPSTSSDARYSGDHPRVCGEHPFRMGVHVAVRGSSPRVRGTLEPVSLPVLSTGIIPACAGNT